MNRKVTREERREIYKKGLSECICDTPGECQLFMLAMSENLHRRCQNRQSDRDWFLESVKRRDTDQANIDYQKKLTEQAANAKIDNAILALESQGIGLEDKRSKGLGDTVAKVLGAFGITKEVISKTTGSNCNCDKRKAWLNKIFPYGVKEDD
tara:strand:- start:15218 stop:15676 length:459 start_codon:yes stop_codon:yes gene_type:complete